MIFIEPLKRYLDVIFNRIKSIDDNIHVTTHLLHQIRHESMGFRTDSFDQNFRILLTDLNRIRSDKTHFQLLEKQHDHSKKIFKKIFNIQSSINIDPYHQQYRQSMECLNELRRAIKQQEDHLDNYKEKILEQNQQINIYSNDLHRIQLEQSSLRCDIQQLNQQIQFEKRLHIELNSNEINSHFDLLEQFHTEYINLTTQITRIQWNIQQTSIDLLPLQLKLNQSSDHLEDISYPSVVIIESSKEKMMQLNFEILPRDIIHQSECTKIQSRKSKECSYSDRMRLEDER